MKTRPRFSRAAVPALAVAAALALAACGGAGEPGGEHAAEAHADEHAEHTESAVVELSPEAIARIGLTTVPAAVRPLAGRRATTGRVGFDESRLAHVAPRVPGRLVRVDAELGERVAAGETMAVVDSIDLGEARAAYLAARARHEVAAGRLARERSLAAERISTAQEVAEAEAAAREAAAELAAGRERLELLGLPAGEIAALGWDDPGAARVSVRAPFAGRVVAKEATRGELATPERHLFTVADLSRVWVWLDVYERDLRHVRPGEAVEVAFEAWPGETFRGEIAYVADQVDPDTRTLRARVDLPNPDARLKPGMFATVEIAGAGVEAEPALVVPRQAVERDGDQPIVFVRAAPGRFERREVELGRTAGELVEIVAGLAAGEEVVARGSFLLRSQASADELGGHHH